MNSLERMKKVKELYINQDRYISPYFMMSDGDILGFLNAHDEMVKEAVDLGKKWRKRAIQAMVGLLIQCFLNLVMLLIVILK